MSVLSLRTPKPKKCRVAECRAAFVPARLGQAVCSPACALADASTNREKARKAIDQRERREIKGARDRLRSRNDYMRDAQQTFNAWVRLRDAVLPCVSCGRFHDGQWHAGHYRTVGANPELRFEPLNVHKQCAPCNNHKSGDIVNYRINLVKRIGIENVAWLEGPHKAQRHTIEDLKVIKADYRAKIKELKRAAA